LIAAVEFNSKRALTIVDTGNFSIKPTISEAKLEKNRLRSRLNGKK
jgi:hypothetical protein